MGNTIAAARHARTVLRLGEPGEASAVQANSDAALRDLDESVIIDERVQASAVLTVVKPASTPTAPVVVDLAWRVIGIEIKAAAAVNVRGARHLAWLRTSGRDRFVHGLVLHAGLRRLELADWITTAPHRAAVELSGRGGCRGVMGREPFGAV